MTDNRRFAAIALPLILLATSNALGAIDTGNQLKRIALSGDPAPGTGGGLFQSLNAPDINDLGNVAFIASLECCIHRGTVYSTGRGALELVAFQQAPGEPGEQLTFDGFSDVQLDNLGRTLIRAEMHSLPSEFDAVWVGEQSEMLTPIVVSGQAVDPSEPDTTYRLIDFPHFGKGGVLAARAVTITNNQVAPSPDVLFRSDGTGLAQPLLRAGDQLDFLPDGVVLGGYFHHAFDNPVVNDHGQIAVRASTIDTRGGSEAPFGSHLLLIEPDGSYTSVIDSAPDNPPFGAISSPVLNDQGAIAFGANPGFPPALWRKLPGQAPEQVVQLGDEPTSMPGVIFDHLFVDNNSEMPLWISNRGEVAFWASLAGEPIGSDFAESVWIGSPDNLRPVLVEGDEAPGTGGVFASMTSTIGDLVSDMAVNDKSQVAVLATFEVVPGNRRHGLFATDLDGNLHKIVAYGDFLEIGPGDLREVTSVSFEGDAHARRGTGLNDRGEIAFSVRFSDGSYGTFVSSVVAIPEPSTAAIATIAWGGVVGFYRSRGSRRRR